MVQPPLAPLESWVQEFLRGPGNNLAFADGLLLEPRVFHGPLTLPLSALTRCCGPEEGMRYRTGHEDFERRVESLRGFLRTGGELPPLIINYSEGAFHLNDGNHRHEAYRRDGQAEVRIIVWTTGQHDHDEFVSLYGPWLAMEAAWDEGHQLGRQGVVGCLVLDPQGRVFAQRRSPNRRTFPGCWDLVGGHEEPGESPRQTLVRELNEETGWHLENVIGLREVVDWESPAGDGAPVQKRELVVAVTVRGDWDHPALEAGKVTEGRWFDASNLEILRENRSGGDDYVYNLVKNEVNLRNRLQIQ